MLKYRPAALMAGLVAGALALPALAEGSSATMHAVSTDGIGEIVGVISFEDGAYGLLIHPQLQGLEAGLHGLHVHQNADCAPAANDKGEVVAGGAAGGHYDPLSTGRHEGPYGAGRLGDLPNLVVVDDGSADLTLLAPRLTTADLAGRAIMIHAGPDDYSDHHPGGSRAWCGVVE